MSENATNEKNCRHGIDRSIVLCTDCDAAEGRFLERAELTKQINDLPEMLRQYVHDLEADADPAGDKMRIVCLEENMAGLTDEIDRQRAEIERLTRERDEARSASVPGSAAVFAAVEAERDRMRAALEKIADFDCRSDEHVGDMKCWSCYARDALSSEPSPDETTARRMTRAEADAMNRAFWRSVEIIDDIDDREEVAPGDARYYRPSENPSICPYGQSDCETTRGGVCQCAMPAEQAGDAG